MKIIYIIEAFNLGTQTVSQFVMSLKAKSNICTDVIDVVVVLVFGKFQLLNN